MTTERRNKQDIGLRCGDCLRTRHKRPWIGYTTCDVTGLSVRHDQLCSSLNFTNKEIFAALWYRVLILLDCNETSRTALRMAVTQDVNNRIDSDGGSALSIDEAYEMWIEEARRHNFGDPSDDDAMEDAPDAK